MNTIPKELEETQLNLQVVIDPGTKCITMKTHTQDIPANVDVMPKEIIPNDPLHYIEEGNRDLKEMTELEKLIYFERRRVLNIKIPPSKKSESKDGSCVANTSETDSNRELTQKEKMKLRKRKSRERATPEEREFSKFRHRIITMKMRLMQKLQNFEDETLLREIAKRDTDRIKKKRLEQKSNETLEQRTLRLRLVNSKQRLAKKRLELFKTPEELLADRERSLAYMKKFRSRHTEGQRHARLKVVKEKNNNL